MSFLYLFYIQSNIYFFSLVYSYNYFLYPQTNFISMYSSKHDKKTKYDNTKHDNTKYSNLK